MPEERDDSFLLRWSRRKRGIESSEPEVEPSIDNHQPDTSRIENAPLSDDGVAPSTLAETGPAVEANEHEDPEAVPPELAHIDIETLDYESDFTPFLKDGVPEALKRRALRQLWRSNPVLANVDGLTDYDDDYTDAAMAVDVLKTAHKVGRGFLEDEDDEDLDEAEIGEARDADGGEDRGGGEPVDADTEQETPVTAAVDENVVDNTEPKVTSTGDDDNDAAGGESKKT